MSSIEEQVDARLLALELRVGLAAMTETKVPDSDNDIASRIDLLEQKWKSSTTATFNQIGDTSDKLLNDLHPGPGLTYQQVLSGRSQDYPMLYRKQVVLASQDALRRDMSHLSNILNLLYISQKSPLKDVTQAPILNIPPVSPEEEKRLDVLRVTAAGCHNQAAALANRMDSLIATYQQAMIALSDRMIRLEERISQQRK
jgi:hypothetical protein